MNSSKNTKALNDDELITLRYGTKVQKWKYDIIFLQMVEKIPSLQPDRKYTVKKICGREFWSLLDEDECKLVGKCAALMVAQGELALESTGTNPANHLLYRLK